MGVDSDMAHLYATKIVTSIEGELREADFTKRVLFVELLILTLLSANESGDGEAWKDGAS